MFIYTLDRCIPISAVPASPPGTFALLLPALTALLQRARPPCLASEALLEGAEYDAEMEDALEASEAAAAAAGGAERRRMDWEQQWRRRRERQQERGHQDQQIGAR